MRGVVVNVPDYDIVVSKFKLKSPDNIHFWANTFGKGMNPFILAAFG